MEEHISDWLVVPQSQVSAFAELTNDKQYIHIDPDMAAQTPFGGTIAHGFLVLSMLTELSQQALPAWDHPKYQIAMSVNYGFDKIRFLAPVRTGSRIRARFSNMTWREKGEEQIVLQYDIAVEIEGEARPAIVAKWLYLLALMPKQKSAENLSER